MSMIQEETKASVISVVKPPPSWVEWCERNAKPIERRLIQERRYLTRWQIPGPMKKAQWREFYEWAASRAMPKELPVPVKQPIPCVAKFLPCARKPRAIDPDEFQEKVAKLATPLERKMTPKHQYIYPIQPYSPIIVWGQPPLHDKGRPFKPPNKPCCFFNADIEDKWWAELRFPIRKAALKARITPRILSLSKPKITPQFPPHCYHPEHIYDVLNVKPPRRKKFTPQGWRLHQIRLLYLSKPVSRPEYEYFYM
ncbi:uncharacterized protein LOC6619083 [Drosophila sechellia]|uniref:GM26912 n=1 Tax=Drosophila sechellia TaxID=7238 RepID=B4IHW3_DROSE|nr:uncharacterized protein LOC6619083 [Drosophila sechellia]EDW49480.1 GM26912 [Drosophila sechellia]